MQPPKSSQTVTQRTLLSSGLLHGGKNVPNADKFEKFELLKERFKNYRENVLKIGFENLLKTHPTLTASCTNIHMSNFNLYSSTAASSPTSTLNLNKQPDGQPRTGGANPQCPCSFCSYCAQQQTILTEIAYLNNLEHDIKEIRDYLRDTRKKLESKEMKVKLALDWKQVALVLDRTFFFVYLIITAFTLFIMYPRESIIVNTHQKPQSAIDRQAAQAAANAAAAAASAALEATTAASILSALTDAVSTVTSATLAFSNRANEQNSNGGFMFF
jgi:hypothetical protein